MKSILNIHWKDWCLSWHSNTLASWWKEFTHWKRHWCRERLKARGEGDDRGWDGWMASPTQWTWVWVNSGRWWWTGRPDMLRFMGSQRVGHDWATELNWTQCTTNGVCYLAKRLISDPLNFSGRKNSRTAWKDRWETTNIPSYSKVLIAIFNNECQNEKSLKSQI